MSNIHNFLVMGLLEFQESITNNAACIIQRFVRNHDICTICLEKVCKSTDNCHNFHKTCINKWLISGHSSCPICRSHLKCSLPMDKCFFIDTSHCSKKFTIEN